MKQLRSALIFFLLAASYRLNAQIHFLNGSLEPNTSSSVLECSDNPAWRINTMGGDFMTVTGPQTMYVANLSCGVGAPEDSTHYLGLHYSPALHQGNQLLLQLSAPMNAGQSYKFSFYFKGPPPKSGSGTDLFPTDIVYGYSADSSSADSVFAQAGIIADTVWQLKVVSVTPSFATSFVWVGAIPLTGKSADTGITYVDNFIFEPTAIEVVNRQGNIGISPNPVTTETKLRLDGKVSLPAKLVLYDVTGRTLYEKEILKREVNISREGLQNGIYFLKLVDNNHNIYTTKLVAQ
jgi:hypothetical protein